MIQLSAEDVADVGGEPRYLNQAFIKRILREHGIHPSRSMGQNFLADSNYVRKICSLIDVVPGTRVLEIGAGLGSLTIGLIYSGADVVAVEKDARLSALLSRVEPDATILTLDALECQLSVEVNEAKGGVWQAPWKLAANLPYRVAVPIFVKILEEVPEVTSGIVMLQREVAQRLTASPGEPAYGRVTLVAGYFAEFRYAGTVPPGVFVPRPRVESALITFKRRERPPVSVDKEYLFELIKAGFSHRRKIFRNAIAELGWATEAIAGCIDAGVDPNRRAETFTLEDFASIVAYSEIEASAQIRPKNNEERQTEIH